MPVGKERTKESCTRVEMTKRRELYRPGMTKTTELHRVGNDEKRL